MRYLCRRGWAAEAASTGEQALERLAKGRFAVLLTDLRLPGVDGLALVRRAREVDDEMGVLLMTAFASVESAIEAMRVGAHDYLLKPLILEEVARKLERLVAQRDLTRENAQLRRALQAGDQEVDLVAESASMREVAEWVRRAARTPSNVLITGETGTGKEVVARAIHRLGAGREAPFLAVNLAAVPEALVESELFGHERGAFTGAERRREGILRAAGAGTVFLDEIAELAPSAQAKLLRALEGREVLPLGRDTAVPFQARVIAATHRDLQARVADGRFREDLYYRLDILHIAIPPLREHPEDIPALVIALLRRRAAQLGVAAPAVDGDALAALCRHPWRGNVRELSNVLERATILAEDRPIALTDLPPDVRDAAGASLHLAEAVEQFERTHIGLVLGLCGGNRERAAEQLGISPATLYRRLEKLGLKGHEIHRGTDSQP